MEAIFPGLFLAPGVMQLPDGEQLTADDPLGSQQCRQGAAVCPWKQEEAVPDEISGHFRLLPQKNWTGIGCTVSSFLRCHGKKIDCCALLIRQEMPSFHLQALVDSTAFMCALVFVCVRDMRGLCRKDRCSYEYEEGCYWEKWSCSRYSDLLDCPHKNKDPHRKREREREDEKERKFAGGNITRLCYLKI